MSGKEIYEHESALVDWEMEPAEQTAEKVSKNNNKKGGAGAFDLITKYADYHFKRSEDLSKRLYYFHKLKMFCI